MGSRGLRLTKTGHTKQLPPGSGRAPRAGATKARTKHTPHTHPASWHAQVSSSHGGGGAQAAHIREGGHATTAATAATSRHTPHPTPPRHHLGSCAPPPRRLRAVACLSHVQTQRTNTSKAAHCAGSKQVQLHPDAAPEHGRVQGWGPAIVLQQNCSPSPSGGEASGTAGEGVWGRLHPPPWPHPPRLHQLVSTAPWWRGWRGPGFPAALPRRHSCWVSWTVERKRQAWRATTWGSAQTATAASWRRSNPSRTWPISDFAVHVCCHRVVGAGSGHRGGSAYSRASVDLGGALVCVNHLTGVRRLRGPLYA